MWWWLWVLVGCGGGGTESPAGPGPHSPDEGADQQVVGHRPIPADNPVWDQLAEGFRRAPEFYGERSWDDVLMRLLGHYANAARDRAAHRAEQGDLAGAGDLYRALSERIGAIQLEEGGTAARMRDLYRDASRRDADLCHALAGGGAPSAPKDLGPVAALRWKLLTAGSPADFVSVARQASQALKAPPWEGVDIGDFRDFEARHALRLQLTEWMLDSQDPLDLDPVWGHWTPAEGSRQVRVLQQAAQAGTGSPGEIRSLATRQVGGQFSAEDLGHLPTGDSYVDVGGEPGPAAIGSLERLDLGDPVHRKKLTSLAERLNGLLAQSPDQVPAALDVWVSTLDEMGHGSRYYNIKQARNSGVRQLARSGAWKPALAVLSENFPLHAQDFECPNREGILKGLEGRLLLLAGDARAEATLLEAMERADHWMALVEEGRQPMPRQP
jgi:hypothetical protein